MIKLNRIRNIFALTILLSPLFSSGAEEHELLKQKPFDNGSLDEKGQEKRTKKRRLARKKVSSEWNRMFLNTVLYSKGHVKTIKNDLRRGDGFNFMAGISEDGEAKYLGRLAFSLVLECYCFDDPAAFEEKIKHCFKKVTDCIPTEDCYPRISFLVLNHENENNLHIANAGEHVMVIRNGKIIFNSRNRGNLLNPIIYTHSVEEGDTILSLTKGFQESDDAIVEMFLDVNLAEDALSSVYGGKKAEDALSSVRGGKKAMVMRFVK